MGSSVQHNIGILRPGLTFRDDADAARDIPEKYCANRCYLSVHGCGMTGEYPCLYHHGDFSDAGYDGVIEPGMTLCVESYIGEEGGREGVKLVQQVLITDTGVELLSRFPLEDDLLRWARRGFATGGGRRSRAWTGGPGAGGEANNGALTPAGRCATCLVPKGRREAP